VEPPFPEPLTDDAVRAADGVITMGSGDVCPVFPGKRYEDWALDDPAGQGIESVRPIRDEIRLRVEALLDELGVRSAGRDGGDLHRGHHDDEDAEDPFERRT
jgi:protein-tyrosine-phosphatase